MYTQDLAPVEPIHFHGRNADCKLDVWDLDRQAFAGFRAKVSLGWTWKGDWHP